MKTILSYLLTIAFSLILVIPKISAKKYSAGETRIATKKLGTTTVSGYANIANDLGSSIDPLWVDRYPGGINAPDNFFAHSTLATGQTSQYLFPYDYRFNIPCNATITSVTVEVTRRNALPGDIVDAEVRLRLPDYTYSNLNLANGAVWLESTTSTELITYTHANWGNALTPEILNSEMFGIAISATNVDGSDAGKAEIDAINVIVCYDVVGTEYFPIDVDVMKVSEICGQNNGSLTFAPRGGSGNYEYSIDGGNTWSTNPSFTGLSSGDYVVQVRNDDGSCATKVIYCNIGTDEGIVNTGDAVIACKPQGSTTTLVIESIQPFYSLLNAGYAGEDVSCFIEPIQVEYSFIDLCGSVMSLTLDEERNIYTGTTTLYDYPTTTTTVISMIDAITGGVTKLATLPGNSGIGGIDYDPDCDQLFVSNIEDGSIYRLDASSGSILSIYDPLSPDNGLSGYAPLGERVMAVTYNPTDGRLYYSVWANDGIRNGVRNTIRSIAIDPNTCGFDATDDVLELDLPWLSEACGRTTDFYSMPVTDIEFNDAGTTMLLSEVGFNSSIPATDAHDARLLEYDGSTTNWTIDNGPSGGNCKYRIGYNRGTNSRGGNDFAYAGMDGTICTQGDETYVVSTGDALSGISCYAEGCYYGLQYIDAATGGDQFTSIHLDMDRDPASQAKAVYGDVDIVKGCSADDVLCNTTNQQPSCHDVSDGTITVIGSGGSGNYEYSIDGGVSYQTSNVFSNLSAGSYTITIRDTNMTACTTTCATVVLNNPSGVCTNISLSRE